MLCDLFEICHKFLQLNAFFEKLSQPTARIYPRDLVSLDFSQFAQLIRRDQYDDLLGALQNLGKQAGEAFWKTKGSRWETYEKTKTDRDRLDALQDFISRMRLGLEVKSTP